MLKAAVLLTTIGITHAATQLPKGTGSKCAPLLVDGRGHGACGLSHEVCGMRTTEAECHTDVPKMVGNNDESGVTTQPQCCIWRPDENTDGYCVLEDNDVNGCDMDRPDKEGTNNQGPYKHHGINPPKNILFPHKNGYNPDFPIAVATQRQCEKMSNSQDIPFAIPQPDGSTWYTSTYYVHHVGKYGGNGCFSWVDVAPTGCASLDAATCATDTACAWDGTACVDAVEGGGEEGGGGGSCDSLSTAAEYQAAGCCNC